MNGSVVATSCEQSVSVDHLLDLLVEAINTRSKTHVHELRLGVHLEPAEDGLVDLELDDEFLALVLGVGLEAAEDLLLLVLGETVGGDDGDLLLLVELLVELAVLLGDLLDEHQALVLREHLDEADGNLVEVTGLLKASVELSDLLDTDTSILGEQLEGLGVGVEFTEESHVFVDIIKSGLLRGGCEEHGSIAPWDGVFLGGGLVVRGGLNFLDITEGESVEE